jgi:GNAT superfamily N-acetyltransferase
MQKPSYSIIEAGPEWSDRYLHFCQKAYKTYYTRTELGITADLFSEKVFTTSRVAEYFDRMFTKDPANRVWLAVNGSSILGGVCVQKYLDHCEIKGFYVAPDLKGQGIGRTLFRKVEEFADGMELRLDVVNYMQDTINMYKHWGFTIDEARGYIEYPWEGWPAKARYANRGIFMMRPAVT